MRTQARLDRFAREKILHQAIFVVPLVILLGVGSLWLRARPWESRTFSGAAKLGAAAGLAGVLGTALLAMTIVLSARLRFLETPTGGLDRMYRFHHAAGTIAFCLLLVHPSLLAWKYAQASVMRAAHLWFPSTDWALTAGQVALYLMVPLMITTLFVTVRHQVFIWTQRALGIVFIPAAYHVLWAGGDTRNYSPLRAAMAAIVVSGLIALVFHTFLGRFVTRHRQYRVVSTAEAPGSVTELVLEPLAGAMPFVPGQFGFLRFVHNPIGSEAHPFSMASSPTDPHIRFLIKHLGDYTSHVGDIEPGAEAVIEGPYGRFSHRFVRGRKQVWVAGGIGIAPFISMARSLGTDGYSVDLYYCFPDDNRVPFTDELRQLATTTAGLRLQLLCDQRDGFINADIIAERSGMLQDKEYLLCGPTPMMHALRDSLTERGVAPDRIHFEEFGF